jgi:hypothetical protein
MQRAELPTSAFPVRGKIYKRIWKEIADGQEETSKESTEKGKVTPGSNKFHKSAPIPGRFCISYRHAAVSRMGIFGVT